MAGIGLQINELLITHRIESRRYTHGVNCRYDLYKLLFIYFDSSQKLSDQKGISILQTGGKPTPKTLDFCRYQASQRPIQEKSFCIEKKRFLNGFCIEKRF